MDPEIDQTAGTEGQTQDDLEALGADAGAGDQDVDAGAGADGEVDGGAAGEDDDETVITLGEADEAQAAAAAEEAEVAQAPAWVRDVRKTNKELVRKMREQEAEIARLKGSGTGTAAPTAIVLGDRPTMADKDVDYDEDKYEAALAAWLQRKADVDAQQKAQTEARANEEKAWRTRVDAVEGAAAKLKVRDPEGALLAFESTFSVLQRGIIMGAPEEASTSAALRYVLGTNPTRAKALAAVTDPVKFAMKLGDVIREMKVNTRKAAPVPERRVSGNVAGAAAVDNTLNKLREEAARTGNHSKVIAYKNAQKKKAAERA
jgi:hypothetical protein